MSADHVVFDADQYSRLIAELVDLSNALNSASTSGSTPLSADVQLQPDGQIWEPAMNLVAAGQAFFGREYSSIHERLLPELTNLTEGLAKAKNVFENVADLAAMTGEDFNAQLPHLSARIPAEMNTTW